MSVLNKKPYAQKVVESLGQEELQDLVVAINGGGNTLFKSFINLSYPFSEDDKGAHHCVFEAKDNIFTGYLCYSDTYCVLFAYNGDKNQEMKIVKIDYANDKYEIIDEQLSIDEFRQIIYETSDTAGKREFDGDVSIDGDLEVEEDALFKGDADFKGDVKSFENIVDKDGHKRFIEGLITTTAQEGITYNFAKWSLSGSHLLIVIFGSYANGTTISNDFIFGYLNDLPTWIKDKIYPMYEDTIYVIFGQYSARGSGGATQPFNVNLAKSLDGTIDVRKSGAVTASGDKHFRVQFDLLIDNDEE